MNHRNPFEMKSFVSPMNRRQFTKILGLSGLAIGTGQLKAAQRARPQVAITMDDFNWRNAVHQPVTKRNERLLNTLKAFSTKAAVFVIGRNIEAHEGKQLLDEWNQAGHLIGNHTYSHQSLNDPTMTVEAYTDDIMRADRLLKGFTRFQRYFRFPLLREGDTAIKRDGVRNFLVRNNYRVGHVTIDTDDWVITHRLSERLNNDPSADPKPYRDFYLEHMWDRAQYYDSLSRRVLGRSVKHTILVHYNLLNGLFLGDLMDMFKSKGWQFIDAEEAFTDPVFLSKPNILPAGQSILWGLARTNPEIAKELRYPAETGDVVAEQMKKLGL